MIDFRYHLVSLVSVFLALAVGIVLGAGPLKEPIGNTLTSQVQSLREEKDDLRAELDDANTGLERRDEFVRSLAPALTADRLAGRSAVLLALPGVEDGDLESLSEALRGAGATVTGEVRLTDAWTDARRGAFRDDLADRLRGSLPADVAAAADGADATLAAALARALVARPRTSVAAADDTAERLLDGLRTADLVAVDDPLSGLAGSAVVLAPANPDPGGDADVRPTLSDTSLSVYVALASTLDAAAGWGTVVAGPSTSALPGGVVAAVRDDEDVAAQVSTVDTGGTPMGVVTEVLALAEQARGDAGSYGFGDDVDGIAPAPPASAS